MAKVHSPGSDGEEPGIVNPVVGGADEGVHDTYPPRVAALTTPPTPPGDHVMIEVPVPESAVGVPGCVIDVGLADGLIRLAFCKTDEALQQAAEALR